MLLVVLGSKPALKIVGSPNGSTPVIPLNPSMWSNDRFSSISTNTCSMRGLTRRPLPNSDPSARATPSRKQRTVSQATQTSCITQANRTHTAFAIQANALHTHFDTQYQARHTHLATQYHARQKNPAMQFHGVYQWHSSQEVHWLEPSSAHSEHW